MAYQVLARKYRPLRFSDVVGQDHVTRTLLNALAQDRIAHGYIFSGHRGIGKTTIARILASALNCQRAIGSAERPTPEPCLTCDSCLEIRAGNSVDMLEIDAATNRGIDEIRELRDAARYRPARDRFKIILLDEAHQITDAAFNALLKTLEEPPEHIVFMMATTQPEDIPQTIRSRCQHFSFHAVKLDDIVGQLRRISIDENIDVDDATLGLLAEAGDGSMRDALSIMDQAIASAPQEANGRPHVEVAEVRSLMGAVSNVVFEEILAAVHANDSPTVLHVLGGLLDAGNGAQPIARQFVRFLRNCVVARITGVNPEADATGIAAELLQISVEERRRAARAAANFSEEELSRFLAILLRTFDDLGYRQEQRLHLELGLLKLVHVQRLVPVEELLSQLSIAPAKAAPSKPTAVPQPARSMASSVAITPVQPGARPVPVSAPANASATPTARPGQDLGSGLTSHVVPEASAQSAAPAIIAPAPAAQVLSQASSSLDATAPDKGTTSATPSPAFAPSPVISALPARPVAQSSEPGSLITQASGPALPHESLGKPAKASDPLAAPSAVHLMPASNDAVAALQTAVIAALSATKGQTSAAEQLEEAHWTLVGDHLEIQTTLSKTLLPVIVNADADRIIKTTLRSLGHAGTRVKLLPGTPASNGNSTPRKSRPVTSGSAAELAEKHPLVQEAKRLFSAEISNVIDLRGKE